MKILIPKISHALAFLKKPAGKKELVPLGTSKCQKNDKAALGQAALTANIAHRQGFALLHIVHSSINMHFVKECDRFITVHCVLA
ncbi:MAG: hypothetical protein B7Y44_07840 [Sphingomonadales bacterium 28-55-16]|nr:MAG: hypothetical protein B7Y44_07840 [Sphingomonadales bacterium 28-55-16]